MIFRNYSNMLICSWRNIYDFYHCSRRVHCSIFLWKHDTVWFSRFSDEEISMSNINILWHNVFFWSIECIHTEYKYFFLPILASTLLLNNRSAQTLSSSLWSAVVFHCSSLVWLCFVTERGRWSYWPSRSDWLNKTTLPIFQIYRRRQPTKKHLPPTKGNGCFRMQVSK